MKQVRVVRIGIPVENLGDFPIACDVYFENAISRMVWITIIIWSPSFSRVKAIIICIIKAVIFVLNGACDEKTWIFSTLLFIAEVIDSEQIVEAKFYIFEDLYVLEIEIVTTG